MPPIEDDEEQSEGDNNEAETRMLNLVEGFNKTNFRNSTIFDEAILRNTEGKSIAKVRTVIAIESLIPASEPNTHFELVYDGNNVFIIECQKQVSKKNHGNVINRDNNGGTTGKALKREKGINRDNSKRTATRTVRIRNEISGETKTTKEKTINERRFGFVSKEEERKKMRTGDRVKQFKYLEPKKKKCDPTTLYHIYINTVSAADYAGFREPPRVTSQPSSPPLALIPHPPHTRRIYSNLQGRQLSFRACFLYIVIKHIDLTQIIILQVRK